MKPETRKRLIRNVATLTKTMANARRQQASTTPAQKKAAREALRKAQRELDEFFGVEHRD